MSFFPKSNFACIKICEFALLGLQPGSLLKLDSCMGVSWEFSEDFQKNFFTEYPRTASKLFSLEYFWTAIIFYAVTLAYVFGSRF